MAPLIVMEIKAVGAVNCTQMDVMRHARVNHQFIAIPQSALRPSAMSARRRRLARSLTEPTTTSSRMQREIASCHTGEALMDTSNVDDRVFATRKPTCQD